MITRTLVNHPQGSPEWMALRQTGYGASELSAAMGINPYVTRDELLARKASGIPKEYSDWFQEHVLDNGHAVEALARPFAEDELDGDELYPAVYRVDGVVDGAPLIASCDGLTMSGRIAWECKQWNAADADLISAGFLPEKHEPQCQQVMLATGAERLLFTMTDGTRENTLHLWVEPGAGWPQKIASTWRQFHADRLAWTPPAPTEAKPIGKIMDSLPALRILVKGAVEESNIDRWAEIARTVLGSINRTLNTDQDFADAEQAIKWCADQEAALEAAKQHALSQTESIDKLFKTVDAIKEETRQIRLEQTKLVEKRKTERKTELVGETAAEWKSFVDSKNALLSPYMLPAIATDFAAQIKNKRNFESMSNALGVELARAKIAAAELTDRMALNIKSLEDVADFRFLFNDDAALIQHAPDHLALIIRSRISDHNAEQKRKAEEAAEAAREKIRAEEAAKLKAEQEAREKAERDAQAERDRQAAADQKRIDDEAAAERRRQDEESRQQREKAEADLQKLGQAGAPVAADAEPSAAERRAETFYSSGDSNPALKQQSPAALKAIADAGAPINRALDNFTLSLATEPEHAWINIGKMNEAFGFTVTADFIVNTLGFQWTRTEKAAKFWTPTQFEAIKIKLAAHVREACAYPF